MKLSIIIPAYNEEQNIPRLDSELIPFLKGDYEILIVDDGSNDNTAEQVLKLKKKHKHIKLIKHPKNLGLGYAIRTGIKNAKGDIIITLDADFTFHPSQIPLLLEAYKQTKADCIIGSPLLKSGYANVVKSRLFLSKAVNMLYQLLLGKRIKAVSTIFRLYRSSALKRLKLSSKGFTINAEILFKFIQEKKKILEIPAVLTKRKFGKSKIKTLTEIKNHLILLGRIFYWKLTKD